MKRSTSLLLTGAMSLGTVAVLSVAAPGVASAGGCGPETLDQAGYASSFDSARNDTRSKGSIKVEKGGALRVTTTASPVGVTPDQSKASAYYDVEIPLWQRTAESGYDLDITNVTGGKPGYNLVVDFNGPAAGGEAFLTKEEGLYGDKWWTNSTAVTGVAAGSGYAHLGFLQEYADANPDAVIKAFGFSLGSGVVGDNKITGITFGCVVFGFGYTNTAPVASYTATQAGNDRPYTVVFDAKGSTDVDGDELSYSWYFGDDTTGQGIAPTHTFKQAGTYRVELTVSDGTVNHVVAQDIVVKRPTETVDSAGLPNTGANVLGMAAVGAVVLAGSGAGMVATRRRRAGSHTA